MNNPGTTIPAADPSGFFKIPLEIRDEIYKMLLTTPYNTQIDWIDQYLKFRLHTAIMRTNKQVSTESTKVLYNENHFIIVKFAGQRSFDFRLQAIPTFKFLSKDRVAKPLLKFKIERANLKTPIQPNRPITFITTPDGLQSMISAISKQQKYDRIQPHIRRKITLDFSTKAPARYGVLSKLVLQPWERLHNIEELELTGDIKEPMVEHLKLHVVQGPFPIKVNEFMERYRLLAEREYHQKDFKWAQWQWAIICDYWDYLYAMRALLGRSGKMFTFGNELENFLQLSHPIYVEGRFGQMKSAIHESEYFEAYQIAGSTCYGTSTPYKLSELMTMKFALCCSFAQTALGKFKYGMEHFELAVSSFLGLFPSGRYGLKSKSDVQEELRSALDNELMKNKSVWRIRDTEPLLMGGRNGKLWEPRKVCRSFWEWLDEPEDGSEVGNVD